MTKKNILLIVGAVVALIALVVGIFLIIPKNSPEPTPAPSESTPVALNPVTNSGEYQAEVDKFRDTPEVQDALTNYSTYVNWDGSKINNLNADFVVPMAWVAGKYVEQGFFNPYFVSGFWENKDSLSENAINKYLSANLSPSLKEEYVNATKNKDTAKGFFGDKVYFPDEGYIVPTECAENWVEEQCFRLPSKIDSISFEGTSERSALVTVDFTMHVNLQNPNLQDGVLTDQEKKYRVTFDILFDNAEFKDLSVSNIQINKVSGSLEIKNTDDTWSDAQ